MKKIHLNILLLGLVLSVLSGYSIAAINMVYNINFEWYSKLNNDFKLDVRNTNFYELSMLNKQIKPQFEVIANKNKETDGLRRIRSIFSPDLNKYIYIYCSLGEVTQIDSNIKIKEMAQRGNNIEVVAAINITSDKANNGLYYPEDIVRVDRSILINNGKVLFVLKNQFGARIGEYEIDIKD